MDRHIGKGKMDQAKSYEQVRCTASDPRNEGLDSVNQGFFHDPWTNTSANVWPPDYVISAPPRPVVLNYSIQTGEEFAFEFMRDRVIPKQQFIPNIYGEPSGIPVYVGLNGATGLSHPMLESESNTSVLNASEKNHTLEHERKIPSVVEVRSHPEPLQVASSRNDSNQRLQSFGSSRASDGSLNQVKFLYSFGGKILPRPRDRKLRYVGGETRIIQISKDISYEELLQRMTEIYSESHAIKYQLPGEDLDALVSVSCDEDLQNMMEECSVLSTDGSEKPRMFLFSSSDVEEAQFVMGAVEGESEVRYVVAINGMDLTSRKGSLGASASGNNLEELLIMNAEREIGRVDSVPASASAPFSVNRPLSAIQSSQQGASFPADKEPFSQPDPVQQVHLGGVVNHPVCTSAPIASSEYQPLSGYSPHAMNPVMPFERPAPLHQHQTQQAVLREEQMIHAQDPDPLLKEVQLKRDGSFHKVDEPAIVSAAMENNISATEPKMKREFSNPRVSEYGISSVSRDYTAPDNVSKEETLIVTQVANSTPDMNSYILPEKSFRKSQDLVQNPGASETAIDGKKANQEDQSTLPGGFSASGYVISGGDSSNLNNCDQPVIHQRVFHSECILQEQAETNRLSKSNDSLGSQFLMAQTSTDPFQPISESTEKFHDASMGSQNVHSIPPVKVSSKSTWTAEDKTSHFEKSEESSSKIDQINSSISKDGPESIGQIPEQQHLRHPMNDLGTMRSKENFEDRSMNQNEAAFLNQLTRAESTYVDQSHVTAPKQPEFGWNNNMAENNWDSVTREQVSSSETSANATPRGQLATGPGSPEQGDIVVDINDRFPRDFLADIFSKAKEDALNFSGLGPLHGDGAGMSLNVQNYEPKNWSYFRKDEFVRKDLSLMDQDHPGFPTTMTNTGGAPIDYSFPPLQ